MDDLQRFAFDRKTLLSFRFVSTYYFVLLCGKLFTYETHFNTYRNCLFRHQPKRSDYEQKDINRLFLSHRND